MNAPNPATQHFRSTLPPDQAARWDEAMLQYEATARANAERWEGRVFTEAEWEDWKKSASGFMCSYQPGHHSSALFRRLLEGFQPLELPPPVAHSYPWYEVIEKPKVSGLMVAFEGERASAMTLSEHSRRRPSVEGAIGIVQINQSIWEVLERSGDQAIVTYGEWAGRGYRWKLSFEERDVDDVQARIFCYHDPSKHFIRTGDELWREATWRIEKQVEEERAVFEGRSLPQRGGKPLPAVFDEQTRSIIKARLDKRIARGHSAIPSRATIRRQIKACFEQYLRHSKNERPSWRIDADGRLKALQWELERIAPAESK